MGSETFQSLSSEFQGASDALQCVRSHFRRFQAGYWLRRHSAVFLKIGGRGMGVLKALRGVFHGIPGRFSRFQRYFGGLRKLLAELQVVRGSK